MSCEQWFEAVSALADGEDPGIDPRLVEAHLDACLQCRRWHAGAADLRRPLGVAEARPVPDVSRRVARLVAAADRASRWVLVRVLLAVVAVYLVGSSLQTLLWPDVYGSYVHAARHLGSFTLAYGVCLLVVVARPARARTVLPAACILVVALLLTAVVDVVDGQATVPRELGHVPEALSVVLLWLLAVPALHRRAGTSPGREDARELRLVRGAGATGPRRPVRPRGIGGAGGARSFLAASGGSGDAERA